MKTDTIFVVASFVFVCVDDVVDTSVTEAVEVIPGGAVLVIEAPLVVGCSPSNPSDTMFGVLLLSV